MYNVENRDTIWTVYKPNSWSRKLIVKHFKTEKELIRFLAFGYTETYVFDDPRLFLMDHIDCNNRFHHEYYDGYGRKIEPRIYKRDAWSYYVEHIKQKSNLPWYLNASPRVDNYTNWRKKHVRQKKYHGEFRHSPVSGISKWKGGPYSSGPRYKHIRMMYDNPEYKGFNRGDSNCYPWRYRYNERNWKSQRKHQWKEKK